MLLTLNPACFLITVTGAMRETRTALPTGGDPQHTIPAGQTLVITPTSEGTYTAAVTVSTGGVSKTASVNIVCTAQRPGTRPPEVTHPSFTGPIPAVATSGNTALGTYC